MNLFKKISLINISPGLFRLLLAFSVVVYHSVTAFPIGHYAVYVFFILSGYWIFKMYKEKYIFYKNEYRVFLLSRLIRLLPVYWIILLITFLSMYLINPTNNNLGYKVINFSNFFIFGGSTNGMLLVPAWSLDMEIQFYIIAPLLIFLCSSIKILNLIIQSIIISLLLIIFVPVNYIVNNIFFYLPFFLIGAWIYLEDISFSRNLYLVFTLLFFICLLLNYAIPAIRINFFFNSQAKLVGFNYIELINIFLAMLSIPFVANNVKIKINNKRDFTLSSMSYVVYLLHWPLLIIYGAFVNGFSTKNKIIPLLFFYIVTIILSYLISITMDNFFEQKRKIWLSKTYKKPINSTMGL